MTYTQKRDWSSVWKDYQDHIKDPNADDRPFTPGRLRDFAKMIEELRWYFLYDTDDAGADPYAEQEYLLALAAMEMAQRHFALASLHQSRGIAARSGHV